MSSIHIEYSPYLLVRIIIKFSELQLTCIEKKVSKADCLCHIRLTLSMQYCRNPTHNPEDDHLFSMDEENKITRNRILLSWMCDLNGNAKATPVWKNM